MKNFVGREIECDSYISILTEFLYEYSSQFLEEDPARTSSVLDIFGVGGIGKTSLLKQLQIITQEKAEEQVSLFSVYIDTSGYDNFVEVLYSIRSKIKEFYNDALIYQDDFFEFDSVYALFYGQNEKNNRSRPLILDIIHEIVQNIGMFDFLSVDVFHAMQTIEMDGMTIVTGSLVQDVIEGMIRALPILYSTVRTRKKNRIEQKKLEEKLRENHNNINSVYQREEILLA